MKVWRYLWLSCLVVGGVLCYGSGSVLAQASDGVGGATLSVGPAIIEKTLTPGKAVSFAVTVRNITDSALPISSYTTGFTVQSNELEKTDESRLDASQWFNIDEPDFILQPKEEQTVTGTIRSPLNVEPGGHYATIFFQPLTSREHSQSIAKASARVGVLTFLSVQGKVSETAKIDGGLSIPKLPHPGPIEMKFKVVNTGNVHVMPKGMINIYDWWGKKVDSVAVPIGIILPNSTKEYAIPWTVPPTIWRYRAELMLEYGKDAKKLSGVEATFWAMPLGEMVVGSVSALLIAFIVLKTHGRWKRAWLALHAASPKK